MANLPAGIVTFLLTDIEGSTKLWEDHPGAMRQAPSRHDALVTSVVEQHAGTLLKSRGEADSLFTVFARAADAVAAAYALQHVFAAEPWGTPTPPRVRQPLRRGGDAAQGNEHSSAPCRARRS